MLTVSISGSSAAGIQSQVDKSQDVADVIELRSDLYTCQGISSAKPLMVTGPAVSGITPLYADGNESGKIKIHSYHDFKKTPSDLDGVLGELQRQPAGIYKIATTAHSILDSLRMLLFLREAVKSGVKLSAHCMGEAGVVSRILGPVYGSALTYCCLHDPVAPGQLSVSLMHEQYDFKRLSPQTKVYGLIGDPVHLSRGPEVHNRYFRNNGIDAIYVAMRVRREELEAFFEYARKLGFAGLSVTMPLKEEVGRYCNAPDGVWNTIRFAGDSVEVCNTDGIGAVNAVERHEPVCGKRVVLIGAGGCAQAIASELYERGANLVIVNRTVERAERLAKKFGGEFYPLESFAEAAGKPYDILINSTSIGMGSNTASPVSCDLLQPGRIVMDVVASPRETALLHAATEKDCTIIYGDDLWREQAAGQYRFWGIERVHFTVQASKLEGSVAVPPSKSQTLRALILASLAEGECRLSNLLESPDTDAARRCIERLKTGGDMHVGNSGILLRFLTAIASLQERSFMITGDDSICQRPMKDLISALEQLGVAVSSRNGFAPLTVKGPLKGGRAVLSGHDSQPVSALLIAAAFAPEPTEIIVENPGELPYIDMTLAWLDRLGIAYERQGYEWYRVEGRARIAPFTYHVPGDLSSMSFPLAAAVVTGSKLVIENIDLAEPQGDKRLIEILRAMGATIEEGERSITVIPGKLRGIEVDINDCIDTITPLAVIGCFAEGKTVIRGASVAREKECDRIRATALELRKMGAKIDELEDGLIVYQSRFEGVDVWSHGDHRLAMALAVAGFGAGGTTTVHDTACVDKTFPGFMETFSDLGGNIE